MENLTLYLLLPLFGLFWVVLAFYMPFSMAGKSKTYIENNPCDKTIDKEEQ